MLINQNNYEQFFLLYVDQELNPALRVAVEAFVEQHPELKEELELLKETILDPDEAIPFEQLNLLKKPHEFIHEGNVEAYIIKWQDQELDVQEVNALKKWLAVHPEFLPLVEAFQHARLLEKSLWSYPYKEELYRYTLARRVYLNPLFRVAAVILILISVGFWYSVEKVESSTVKDFVKYDPPAINIHEHIPVKIASVNSSAVNKLFHPVSKTALTKAKLLSGDQENITVPKVENLATIENREATDLGLTMNHVPVISNNLPTPLPEHEMYKKVMNEEATPIALTDAQLPVSDVPDEIEVFNTKLTNKVAARKIFRTLSRVVETATGLHPAGVNDTKVIQVANFEFAKN